MYLLLCFFCTKKNESRAHVLCRARHPVRLDRLVPDVAMADFAGLFLDFFRLFYFQITLV